MRLLSWMGIVRRRAHARPDEATARGEELVGVGSDGRVREVIKSGVNMSVHADRALEVLRQS